jgi:hypothetical protein
MGQEIKRKSFVFNIEWQEVLMDYPPEVRLEVYDAIIEYVASGTLSELKPLAKMAFSFIKKQIDYNNDRYDDIVAKRSEAGKKGMANRYQKVTNVTSDNKDNKCYQKVTNVTSDNKDNKCYQKVTNVTINDNDNDNDNKESTNVDKKESFPKSDYERFNEWLKEHTPNVLKLQRQITEEEFLKLKKKYSYDQIVDILQSMDNYKDAPKKYTSVYLTFLKWAKKEYGS